MLTVVVKPRMPVVCDCMDFDTFSRYMEGRCSPAEIQAFERWWKEHPEVVDAWFERVWKDKPDEPRYDLERQEIWEGLNAELPLQKRRSWWPRVGYAVAAALAAVVVGYALLRHMTASPGPMEAWVKIENTGAQPRHLYLPDSTDVWLNGHSTIEYARGFNVSYRKTRLSGEAFFRVAKDPERPFSVESSGVLTTVLGTEFNIDAYPGERALHVALVKGSVRVGRVDSSGFQDLRSRKSLRERDTSLLRLSDTSLLLTPGEVATYFRKYENLTAAPIAVEDVSAWTKGKLVLDQVDLSDVMHRISLETGVTVTLDKKVSARSLKISGQYNLASVDKILQSIAFVHRLRVIRRQQDQFFLTE